MKTSKLFVLGLLALTFTSCASPEERAARKNNPLDTNKTNPGAAISAKTVDSNQTDSSSATQTAGPVETPPTETSATPAPAAEQTAKAATPKAAMPGEALLKKSDCLACHNAKVKIVGPAYADVAAKYPATAENIDMLANKIIAGGSGVWGEVPMSPHPSVSKGDAKEMVKYILSLKK
ncbi:MAG: c-type cytochrome [Pedobacter sp.]|nr:c-type cytochrome [Pedobacter sp.]